MGKGRAITAICGVKRLAEWKRVECLSKLVSWEPRRAGGSCWVGGQCVVPLEMLLLESMHLSVTWELPEMIRDILLHMVLLEQGSLFL